MQKNRTSLLMILGVTGFIIIAWIYSVIFRWIVGSITTLPISPKKSIVMQKISSGTTHMSLQTCEKNPLVAIYMYHYVRPSNENTPGSTPDKLSIQPEVFDLQMEYLHGLEQSGKITIIHFSDLEKYDASGCYPNKKIVLLTSDDGWDDGYRFIFPTIERYQIPFHFGIIANRVAKGSGRIDTFMNETEIKTMLHSPFVELLSHSYTHADMPKEDETDLRHELCDSKSYLEANFGIKVNTFVYPIWHDKPFVEDMVRKCGYRYALVIRNMPFYRNDAKDDLALTRIRIEKEVITPEKTFKELTP